jgi:hypothetical protein
LSQPAFFMLSRLLQLTSKVYYARRHSSLFLITSLIHFIYERLSSVLFTDTYFFLEGYISDKGTSDLSLLSMVTSAC